MGLKDMLKRLLAPRGDGDEPDLPTDGQRATQVPGGPDDVPDDTLGESDRQLRALAEHATVFGARHSGREGADLPMGVEPVAPGAVLLAGRFLVLMPVEGIDAAFDVVDAVSRREDLRDIDALVVLDAEPGAGWCPLGAVVSELRLRPTSVYAAPPRAAIDRPPPGLGAPSALRPRPLGAASLSDGVRVDVVTNLDLRPVALDVRDSERGVDVLVGPRIPATALDRHHRAPHGIVLVGGVSDAAAWTLPPNVHVLSMPGVSGVDERALAELLPELPVEASLRAAEPVFLRAVDDGNIGVFDALFRALRPRIALWVEELVARGQFEDLAAVATTIVSADPESGLGWRTLGQQAWHERRHRVAAQRLERARSARAADRGAALDIVRLHLATGTPRRLEAGVLDDVEALAHSADGLGCDPLAARALVALHRQRGDDARARDLLDELEPSLSPYDVDALEDMLLAPSDQTPRRVGGPWSTYARSLAAHLGAGRTDGELDSAVLGNACRAIELDDTDVAMALQIVDQLESLGGDEVAAVVEAVLRRVRASAAPSEALDAALRSVRRRKG